MGKRREGSEPDYSLNTKAVDDLVNASSENTEKYSPEELEKYRSKSAFRLSPAVRALLIKYWFAGMVCFFFIWGLGMYITDQLDLFFVTALAMGFVTDILVNNIFRFYEKTPGENERWMMYPKKSFMSLVLNILHAFVLMFCVFVFYNLVNVIIVGITGNENSVPFGVEPFSFGLVYLGFDMLFIWFRHLWKSLLSDAKAKTKADMGV